MTQRHFPRTARNRHAVVHELRYQSLFCEGRGFSFPCDERGSVDLEALSERARNNYLFARAMVGRELATPEVRVVVPDVVPIGSAA